MRRLSILALAFLLPFPALAGGTIPGPITARVVSVYDGDTITVDASPWPGMTIRVGVRVDGIDTPEIRGKCDEEKALALRARDRLRALVGSTVRLVDVRRGKYAGRVIARILVRGRPVGAVLVAEGLARPYSGGRRGAWCE